MPEKLNLFQNTPTCITHKQQWDDFGVSYLRSPKANVPEHFHDELQIFIPLKHSSMQAHFSTATGEKRSLALKYHELCIIPSQQLHTVTWEKNAEVILFFLHPNYLKHVAHDLITVGSIEIGEHYGTQDLMLHQLGVALKTEFLSQNDLSRLYVESLFNVLAVHLLRTYGALKANSPVSSGSLTPGKLKRVTEYINENLEQELSIKAIANIVQLSPYHFARSFKQTVGLSPHQYITQQRIAQASVLLSQTELPITEICHQVGYQSQSHFTAIFRKHHQGITPRNYRLKTRQS